MNMTIKAQAFLQGYMREKAASYPLDPNPRVTPIVAAPGIPQTEGDPGVKPIFQDGKARFKRTQQQMPPTTLDDEGLESFTPASVNDQLLQNLPIPAAGFVSEQRKNYERDRLPWNKPQVRPWRDLIDFEKRNQPVSLDTPQMMYFRNIRDGLVREAWSDDNVSTRIDKRRIAGLDPEKLRKHPEGEWQRERHPFGTADPLLLELDREYEWEDDKKEREYSGYPEAPDGGAAGHYDNGVPVLGHEGTHNYTGGPAPEDFEENDMGSWIRRDPSMEPGTSYITDRGAE